MAGRERVKLLDEVISVDCLTLVQRIKHADDVPRALNTRFGEDGPECRYIFPLSIDVVLELRGQRAISIEKLMYYGGESIGKTLLLWSIFEEEIRDL